MHETAKMHILLGSNPVWKYGQGAYAEDPGAVSFQQDHPSNVLGQYPGMKKIMSSFTCKNKANGQKYSFFMNFLLKNSQK